MITKSFIESIKQKVSIVDLIDSYVPLKKQGKEFVACCPFHAESSPSFKVNEDKQMFHCFGCGENGGVIDFVMNYESLGFSDAVETIAAKFNLTVEREFKRHNPKKTSDAEIKLTTVVKNVFAKQGSSLAANLGINAKTINELELGAGLNSVSLQQLIRQDENLKKTSAKINFHSGYLKNPSDDKCLVVPLYKPNKQFAGLYIDSQKGPYHIGLKGDDKNLLFNPNKIVVRNEPILILSSMIDTIKSYDAGIPNCMCIADTNNQILNGEMLRTYRSNKVIHVINKAQVDTHALAMSIIESIKTSNAVFNLKVLITNDKIRIAEVVNKYGLEILPDVINKANTWYDFVAKELTIGKNTQSEEFKDEIANLLVETFNASTKHKDITVALHLIAHSLGKCAKVDPNAILELTLKSNSEHISDEIKQAENKLIEKHLAYSSQSVAGIPIRQIDLLTARLILESKGTVEIILTNEVSNAIIDFIGNDNSFAKVLKLMKQDGYLKANDIKSTLGEIEHFQVNSCLQDLMLDDGFTVDAQLTIDFINKRSKIEDQQSQVYMQHAM